MQRTHQQRRRVRLIIRASEVALTRPNEHIRSQWAGRGGEASMHARARNDNVDGAAASMAPWHTPKGTGD